MGPPKQVYDQDAEPPYGPDPTMPVYKSQTNQYGGASNPSHQLNAKMKPRKGTQDGRMPDDQMSANSANESSFPVESYEGKGGSSFDSGPAGNKMTIRFGENVSPEQQKLSNKVRTTKYTMLTWAPLSLGY